MSRRCVVGTVRGVRPYPPAELGVDATTTFRPLSVCAIRLTNPVTAVSSWPSSRCCASFSSACRSKRPANRERPGGHPGLHAPGYQVELRGQGRLPAGTVACAPPVALGLSLGSAGCGSSHRTRSGRRRPAPPCLQRRLAACACSGPAVPPSPPPGVPCPGRGRHRPARPGSPGSKETACGVPARSRPATRRASPCWPGSWAAGLPDVHGGWR